MNCFVLYGIFLCVFVELDFLCSCYTFVGFVKYGSPVICFSLLRHSRSKVAIPRCLIFFNDCHGIQRSDLSILRPKRRQGVLSVPNVMLMAGLFRERVGPVLTKDMVPYFDTELQPSYSSSPLAMTKRVLQPSIKCRT